MTRVAASARRDVADCCAPTSARSSDPPPVLLNQLFQGAFSRRVFFSARGRPAPGSRTRCSGRSAKELDSSCRPRWMVFSSSPVICASKRSPPVPMRLDSTATRPSTLLLIQPTRASNSFADATLDQDEVCPAGNADTHSDAPLLAA